MRWIALSLFSFFIIGCSSTSLSYSKNKIHVQNDSITHSFSGKTLEINRINLSKIFITQNVFKSDYNEILIYENANVNTGYKFKFTYQYILGHIFDASKVTRVREEKGLGFFIIRLKNNQKVFVLAKTGSKKSLTLLYGFSEENFNALLNKQPLVKQDISKQGSTKDIKTLWSQKMIITGTLLQEETRGKPF